MKEQKNSAERLYRILEAMRHSSGNDNVHTVFANSMGVDPKQADSFFFCLSQLIELVGDVKSTISRFEDLDRELFLAPFNKIDAVFLTRNLDTQWGHLSRQLSEDVMLGLRHCAHEIARRIPVPELKENQIPSLLKELEELIEKINSSINDAQLKGVLIRNLETARSALLYYRVRGPEGLNDAATRIAGVLLLNYNQIQTEVMPDENQRKVMDIVWEWVVKIDTVTRVGTRIKGIVSPIWNLIGGGGQDLNDT